MALVAIEKQNVRHLRCLPTIPIPSRTAAWEQDMENVTLHLLKYREAARHLWNVYLRDDRTFEQGTLPDAAALGAWDSLNHNLFDFFVVRHTGAGTPLRVVPTSPTVPAIVSRTKPAKTYWDNPIRHLGPKDDLRFIEFFDFDQSRFFDFSYYRVSIVSSDEHAGLTGHEALIEVQYADVFVDDGA